MNAVSADLDTLASEGDLLAAVGTVMKGLNS
jgi:hypothetical protein